MPVRPDAILIVSHGSVVCGAEQNLLEIATAMRRRGDAPTVSVAFLNYTPPLLEDALRSIAAAGAKTICVLPYFLVAGAFVLDELRGAIDKLAAASPEVKIVLAEALQDHPLMSAAVAGAATRASLPSELFGVTPQTQAFCRRSESCPLYGTASCPLGESA